MTHRRIAATFCLGASLTLGAFAACGQTPGRPATLTLVADAGGAGTTFDTTAGWHVVLSDAHVAFGPVYVYAPVGDVTASLLAGLLPVARAHGGHDPLSGRAVRVEWLEQVAVDLLAAPTTLGTMDGTAGTTDGLEILLDPPDPPNVVALHGHHLWVAGTATKGATSVPFEGGIDIALESPISRAVEGVPLSASVATGGTLTVHVLLARWLADAQFDTLAAPAPGAAAELVPGTQPYNAWYLGARTAAAFTAEYAPPPATTAP